MADAPMRALTVWQPWAGCIAHLSKRVENRVWACPPAVIGQTIAIHAGAKLEREGRVASWPSTSKEWASLFASAAEWDAWRYWHLGETRVRDRANWPAKLPLGAVVATARVAGCHWRGHDNECGDPAGYSAGVICSRWSQPGQWHWELGDVQALTVPVPCAGARKLWLLPAGVAASVRGQLGAAK